MYIHMELYKHRFIGTIVILMVELLGLLYCIGSIFGVLDQAPIRFGPNKS